MNLKPLLVSLFLFSGYVQAEHLIGRVVAVEDGDTFTLMEEGSQRMHKIRPAGMDAPDKGQNRCHDAHMYLEKLILQKDVRAECYKRDRDDRQICTVYVDGKDTGLEMLDSGWAWWERHANEQPESVRMAYEAAERNASTQKKGLWQDERPVPPWEWRETDPVSRGRP